MNENGLHCFSPKKMRKRKKEASSRSGPRKLEMVIGDDGGHFFINEPPRLRPGRGLPIVFTFFQRNPRRQRLVQIIGQRIDVGLIHFAKRSEFAVGFFSVMEFHAVLGEDVADLAQSLFGQPVVRQRLGRGAEDLREVDYGVTRDRKSKLGLFFASAFDTDDDERARVQNRRERSDPRLIVVLRSKIGEHGIREMALHHLGAPQLPLLEENAEGVLAMYITVAAKQFAGGGRRAGARIKQGDIHLALGERSVDERQIADDGSKKSEAKTGFGDNQGTGQAGARNDVAQAEGEEGRAAEIDIRQETGLAARHDHRGPGAILHETEAKHEANGPNSDENEEREWAIEPQQRFTGLGFRDEANHEFPSFPSGPVKKASQPELSRDAARENDGFERVPEHDQKDRDTCSERSRS